MADEMMTLRTMLEKASLEDSYITDPGQAPLYGLGRALTLQAFHAPKAAGPLPAAPLSVHLRARSGR